MDRIDAMTNRNIRSVRSMNDAWRRDFALSASFVLRVFWCQ